MEQILTWVGLLLSLLHLIFLKLILRDLDKMSKSKSTKRKRLGTIRTMSWLSQVKLAIMTSIGFSRLRRKTAYGRCIESIRSKIRMGHGITPVASIPPITKRKLKKSKLKPSQRNKSCDTAIRSTPKGKQPFTATEYD